MKPPLLFLGKEKEEKVSMLRNCLLELNFFEVLLTYIIASMLELAVHFNFF